MTDLSTYCHGVVPLAARVAPWMTAFWHEHDLQDLLARYGSPLNVQSTAPFVAHMQALVDCGAARGLRLTPYFARKANKCLSYVEAARDNGFGIDCASLAEVEQALAAGLPGSRIVCTAGVKPDALLACCVEHAVTVIVDNDEELAQLAGRARAAGRRVAIGLRVAGFAHEAQRLHSRFGYPVEAVDGLMARLARDDADALALAGLQFHLGGYDPAQRASALIGLLPALRRLVAAGKETAEVPFVDMGGGIPMRYLAEPAEWGAYLAAHAEALDGQREPITYDNDALGRRPDGPAGWSAPDAYPTAHDCVQADWLAAVLDTPYDGRALHAHLAELNVELRCEPGRSVLDDCGFTLARVVHVKQDTAGRYVAGIEMNRTQFRTGFAEVMFDPMLAPGGTRDESPALEAYLTGTYCTESEFIFKRRFVFPRGLARNDVLVLPNSAGYLVHFLESRSHQFELAANVFVDGAQGLIQDAIDA
ncbi:alanine racemase [uncultured Salinisphaera sp.]|uniref:alanine racemase n=1 Tax=uncultured Salinisphaera sp. TaxID=359372 RepID=UPI0032B13A04|tara:strand:+ start:170 stop:1603 length:1434 start_codon:yes stop_codon:yes gene_type:complete